MADRFCSFCGEKLKLAERLMNVALCGPNFGIMTCEKCKAKNA